MALHLHKLIQPMVPVVEKLYVTGNHEWGPPFSLYSKILSDAMQLIDDSLSTPNKHNEFNVLALYYVKFHNEWHNSKGKTCVIQRCDIYEILSFADT